MYVLNFKSFKNMLCKITYAASFLWYEKEKKQPKTENVLSLKNLVIKIMNNWDVLFSYEISLNTQPVLCSG